MQVFGRITIPLRRVWNGIATRLGVRKTGLLKLRKDVRSCEYEDVQVMWEMLRRNETKLVDPQEDAEREHYRIALNGLGALLFSVAASEHMVSLRVSVSSYLLN